MLCDVDDGKIRCAECCLQQIDCRTLNALGTVCNVYKANIFKGLAVQRLLCLLFLFSFPGVLMLYACFLFLSK